MACARNYHAIITQSSRNHHAIITRSSRIEELCPQHMRVMIGSKCCAVSSKTNERTE